MQNNYIVKNEKLELSNHSFYDNTIVVDEFDCPWAVIIADK